MMRQTPPHPVSESFSWRTSCFTWLPTCFGKSYTKHCVPIIASHGRMLPLAPTGGLKLIGPFKCDRRRFCPVTFQRSILSSLLCVMWTAWLSWCRSVWKLFETAVIPVWMNEVSHLTFLYTFRFLGLQPTGQVVSDRATVVQHSEP